MIRSGDMDFQANPIITVLSGSLGTGRRGFPSSFRGLVAKPPTAIKLEEILPVLEKNGFVIADFTREKVVIQFFAWRPPEPLDAIDTLEPYQVLEFKIPRAK
jgi:hypothetical protein